MQRKLLVLCGMLCVAAPALAEEIPAGTEKMAKIDREFVVKAAQGGMYEVKVAKLALDKSKDDTVRAFAQKMVDDHSKANDQLKDLASKKGITLPDGVCAKDQKMYDKLAAMTGADFDRAYIQSMVKDHDADVSEFQKEAKSGKDADLKSWAEQTLPTLKEHDGMAKKDRGMVK